MLIFIVSLFIAAGILETLFEKTAFKGLRYNVKTDRKTAEINEHITVYSTIINTKKIPLNYISTSESFPGGVNIIATSSPSEKNFNNAGFGNSGNLSATLVNQMYIKPRSSNNFTRTVAFSRRGRYIFHGCNASCGDFLGISETDLAFSTYSEVVILPARANADMMNKLSGGLIGDISVRRFIFEDPVLTIGFRDYTGREPMKAISWTQSARQNKLIVKNYDYTTELNVAVILNMQCIKSSYNAFTTEQSENMEHALCIVRSLCELLDSKNIPYSFTTNALISGGRPIRLSLKTGFGNAHLASVLETLGRASYEITEPVSKTLHYAKINTQSNRTNVVITPEVFPQLTEAVNDLKKAGNCILIDVSKLEKEVGK